VLVLAACDDMPKPKDDLSTADLAVPDLKSAEDLAVPDLTTPTDLASGPDHAPPPDLLPCTTIDGGSCDDGDPCTVDSCDPAGGCRHVDVNRCAVPVCSLGACAGPDSDGDGLSDAWEQQGGIDFNCDGTIESSEKVLQDVDPLFPSGSANPHPNADPSVKDVFLKYDFMRLADQSGACTADSSDTNMPQASSACDFDQYCQAGVCRGHSDEPDAMAVQKVVDAFRNHVPPIRLHVLPTHDVLAHARVIFFGPPVAACVAAGPRRSVDFYDLKAAHFPAPLKLFAHYAVFGHLHSCDTDGAGGSHCGLAACANPETGRNPFYGESGLAEQPGNDLVVSLGQFRDFGFAIDCGTTAGCTALGGTLMHELGHNLGLDHGGPLFTSGVPTVGAVHVNYKPNHVSVMSYSFQFRGIETAASAGSTTPAGPPRLDYSEFPAGVTPNDLDESSLDESKGLALGRDDISYTFCSLGQTAIPGQGACDFNCDSSITTLNGVDVNNDPLGGGTLGADVHKPRQEWPNLFFRHQCFAPTFADGVRPGAGKHRARELAASEALRRRLLPPSASW
jgi:hypothetical protein